MIAAIAGRWPERLFLRRDEKELLEEIATWDPLTEAKLNLYKKMSGLKIETLRQDQIDLLESLVEDIRRRLVSHAHGND